MSDRDPSQAPRSQDWGAWPDLPASGERKKRGPRGPRATTPESTTRAAVPEPMPTSEPVTRATGRRASGGGSRGADLARSATDGWPSVDEWHEQRARLRATASQTPTPDDDHSSSADTGAEDTAARAGLDDMTGQAGAHDADVQTEADDAAVVADVVVPDEVIVHAQVEDEGTSGGRTVDVPPAWGPGRQMAAPTFHWPGDQRSQADGDAEGQAGEADASLSDASGTGLSDEARAGLGDAAGVGPGGEAGTAWWVADRGDLPDQLGPDGRHSADQPVPGEEAAPDGRSSGGRGRTGGRASRGRSEESADAPIFVWPGERKASADSDTVTGESPENARRGRAREAGSGRRKRKVQSDEDLSGSPLGEQSGHEGADTAGRRTSRRRAQDGEGLSGRRPAGLSGEGGGDVPVDVPVEERLPEPEVPHEPDGVEEAAAGAAAPAEKHGADEWHSEVLAGSSWFGDEQDAGGKKRSSKGRRAGGRGTGWGSGRGSGRSGRGAAGRGGPLPDGPDADSPAAAAPEADPESVARAICLRLLTMAPKTRAQLAEALRKRDVPDEAAGKVLDRFVELGLINDEAFAEAWVDSRHHGRGLAKRALAAELRHRGVDTDTVKDAVERLDSDQEAETARRLVDRKLSSTRSLDPQTRTRRLAGMLARKGYSSGLAYRVIREALEQEGIDLDDDFS